MLKAISNANIKESMQKKMTPKVKTGLQRVIPKEVRSGQKNLFRIMQGLPDDYCHQEIANQKS